MTDTQTPEPKPVKERDNLDLLELVCQLHSRALKYPTKDMHDAYVEARKELESRLEKASIPSAGEAYLCPKCNGQGLVSKPPHIPGDVDHWSSSDGVHQCDVCNGAKVLYKSTHSASFSASESKESILRKKFHGFSDKQWEEIKNTFPYNEMPFAMETYASQSPSASFSLEVVEKFIKCVDDTLAVMDIPKNRSEADNMQFKLWQERYGELQKLKEQFINSLIKK